MNAEKKLSIIVPVYNAENTLERCVQSIEEQDLPHDEFEVILVNDGSTDNSLDIANDLASRYGNITVLTKANGGQSTARNLGISKAIGKYIMFVDSDDYLYPNCLSELIKQCINEDLDVLHFFLNVETPDGDCSRSAPAKIRFDKIYTGEELLLSCLLIGSACNNVFRTSLITSHNLKFPVGIIHEDTVFTTCIFCYVQRLAFADKDVYHYCYNPQSSLRDSNMEKMRKNLYDSATATSLIRDFANTHEDISPFCKNAVIRLNNTGIIGLLLTCLRNHLFTLETISGFLNYANKLGIYPVHGKFLNRRSMLLSKLFNHSHLYMKMYKLRKNITNNG